MKVFVTRHALSQGIFETEAEHCGEEMIRQAGSVFPIYYHGDDWHETREAAVAKAEQMRTKKLAALRRQIAKLEAMTF